MRLPAWVYTYIAVAVTSMWVVLNALDPLLAHYAVAPELHIVMGSVAGAAFGGRLVAGRESESQPKPEPRPALEPEGEPLSLPDTSLARSILQDYLDNPASYQEGKGQHRAPDDLG